MPAPAFGDVGKAVKELVSGGKTGVFQYEPKVTYSGTTSTGVTFTTTAVQKGDRVDASLKAAYSTKAYSVDATYNPNNKISVNGSLADVAPGVKLTAAVVLPDTASAKAGVEYANPYVNLKATVGLTSTPLLEASAASGYKNIIVGGEAGYDSAKSILTKYNIGVGYHAPDYQVAAFLQDRAGTLRLAYAHNVTPTQTVGAEVTRTLATSASTFNLAYSRKLASGAVSKFKIDNAGLLSVLYETKLSTGEKVAGSVQLQATDLSRPVKYGFALDFF